MMRFSVVMPIHNEADFLPFSLPSVYALMPSEIILIFDNCTDNSVTVVERIMRKYDPLCHITVCIDVVPKELEHKTRLSYLMRLGMERAFYYVVLVTAGDIILDPRISKWITQITQFPFMSFEYVDYPVNWRTLVKQGLRFLPLWADNRLSGIYAVDRRVRNECEDPEMLKSIELGEDTLLQQCIRTKYPTTFFNAKNIHLRPREDSALHYNRGLCYWKITRRGFLKTVLSAVVSGRFNLIKGYIHARFGE